MMAIKRYIILLMVSVLVVGCGFHLRGVGGVSENFKYSVWNISNAEDMTQPLKKELLRRSGVVIENSADAAVIQVHKINFERQTRSINRYGGVDDFLYTLRIQAQVYYKGKTLGEPIDINIERYMTYRTDSLVVQEEERHLKSEMYANAADMIVNRLYYLPDVRDNQSVK